MSVAPFSKERRANIAAALRGRKLSADHRAKIAAAAKGYKHTSESRAKMSAAKTGSKLGPLSLDHRTKISKALIKFHNTTEKNRLYRYRRLRDVAVRANVLKESGGRCYYCRKKRKLDIDHVVALVNGGTSERSNLVAACDHCNSSKGARQWRII